MKAAFHSLLLLVLFLAYVASDVLRGDLHENSDHEQRLVRRVNKKDKKGDDDLQTKKGLIIGNKVVQPSVEHFNEAVSWFYNYKQTPLHWQGPWADKNGVEFVPMIAQPYANNIDGSIRCYFDSLKTPTCTLEDVIDVLTKAKKDRKTPIQYLMGFNEMYNNPPPKDLTPEEAADYWRTFVQPAAVAVGLKLVSPTTKASKNGILWFSDFLKACWDKRNEEPSCDIELINKFAVHEYDCKASSWKDLYGGDRSNLINLLKEKLGDYGGKKEKEWNEYLKSRDLWITETNCYWEAVAPHPSSKEQCLRITGQKPGSHGKGSIAEMEEIENIERYSWWATWNKQIKPNYLTYQSGKLTPLGHGYLNQSNLDCNFPGVRMSAEEADFGGQAELFTCESTGTKMIKSLGKGGGTASFAVTVQSAGNYAVNVGFLTAKDRILSVRVNDGPTTTFPFVSSGGWCSNGGVSTVLPIEVESFVAGKNTLTFGVQAEQNEPLIEWISVVE